MKINKDYVGKTALSLFNSILRCQQPAN